MNDAEESPKQADEGQHALHDLENASDEDLAAMSMVLSFDAATYRAEMKQNEGWTRVIVSHIYCDHVLSEFISDNFVNPSIYNRQDKRKYMIDKLEICYCSGLVSPSLFTFLKKINSIRNTFAHNLIFSVAESVKSDVVTLFKSLFPEYFINDADRDNFTYSDAIMLAPILLDLERQNAKFVSLKKKRSGMQLKSAMRDARDYFDKYKSVDD